MCMICRICRRRAGLKLIDTHDLCCAMVEGPGGSWRSLEEPCMHARARTHGRAGGTPPPMGPDCPGVMSDRGIERADRLGTLCRG